MLLRLLIFILITLPLFGTIELKQEYSYSDDTIYSTTLFPDLKEKFLLFKINESRTKYRIKSSKIHKLFQEHNLTLQKNKIRYINFTKKSPIDTRHIERAIKKKYENFYANLHVKNITVTPRTYLKKLDPDFELILHTKNLKHSRGVLSIRTAQKERLFFDYEVDGTIEVYEALHPLKRGETLSALNAIKKRIKFKGFSATPLEHIHTREYRLKRSVKKNHILTQRDIEPYPIVKKGNSVLVQLQSGSVVVEFSAIAAQDGSKNDIISVQKKDGHRIKARVIAPGRVEIQ